MGLEKGRLRSLLGSVTVAVRAKVSEGLSEAMIRDGKGVKSSSLSSSVQVVVELSSVVAVDVQFVVCFAQTTPNRGVKLRRRKPDGGRPQGHCRLWDGSHGDSDVDGLGEGIDDCGAARGVRGVTPTVGVVTLGAIAGSGSGTGLVCGAGGVEGEGKEGGTGRKGGRGGRSGG